eukprot:gb/GECH01008008.1/.p1 GENE.gb/GECH01008008.1/~~gb/GECH01008008.1/.p1  ORF type:complete len:147 (+),score=39.11 gb/GECH01008008.1/:1-441(+)
MVLGFLRSKSKNNSNDNDEYITPDEISYEEKLNKVKQKISDNPIYRQKLEGKQDTFHKFARLLSDKEKLRNSYLSTKWMNTLELYKDINEDINLGSEATNDLPSTRFKSFTNGFRSTSKGSGPIHIQDLKDKNNDDDNDNVFVKYR